MGCWGITALESDNGLDAVRCVRYNYRQMDNWTWEKCLND